jgi:sterol desaturase/sphingolipid hydroxylase (fatty acid hydroxylase superfamily)
MPSRPVPPSDAPSDTPSGSPTAMSTREPTADELDAYLAEMARFKSRRLLGLAALCALLLVPLAVIWAKGWENVNPANPVGIGWVFVGLAVTVCALGAVLADVVYRREL